MTRYDRPELADLLAADYLTGGMSAAARRRFESLIQTHTGIQTATQHWHNRLDAGLLPDDAPAAVWAGVRSRTGAAGDGVRGADVAPLQRTRGWAKHTWQAMTLGLGVLAASLLVSLLMVVQHAGPGTPTAAQMAAVLKGPDGHGAVLTVHHDRLVLTAVGPTATPRDKSFELWMLPKQGRPQAVGLVQLRSSDTLNLPAPALLALAQAKGFAISLEPAGGSPTGQPTGPVIYVGAVVAMTHLQPGAPHLAPGQGGGDFYE